MGFDGWTALLVLALVIGLPIFIDEVFGGLREALQRAVDEGEVVMAVTFSNACPILRGLPDQVHRGGERAGLPRPSPSVSGDDEQLKDKS